MLSEIKTLLTTETQMDGAGMGSAKTPSAAPAAGRRQVPNLMQSTQKAGAFAGLLSSNRERYVLNHDKYAEKLEDMSKDPDTFVYEGELMMQISNAVLPPFFFACLLHYFQEK